jgi:hypothetical protein
MVYRAGEVRRSEDSLTAPDTAYGMSKLLAEAEVNDWVMRSSGRRAHTIRPGGVFGKWENGNFTRLYRSLKRRTFVYVGRSDTVKACVYVKDVVRALLFLANRTTEQEVFNLALPTPLTISEICQSMQTVFALEGKRIPIVPFQLALAAGYLGEALNGIGIKNPIHHRRIEKLWLSSDAITAAGFQFAFDLHAALEDWRTGCADQDIFQGSKETLPLPGQSIREGLSAGEPNSAPTNAGPVPDRLLGCSYVATPSDRKHAMFYCASIRPDFPDGTKASCQPSRP